MQIVPCPSFSSPLPTTAPPCSNFYAQKSPHFRSTLQKKLPRRQNEGLFVPRNLPSLLPPTVRK